MKKKTFYSIALAVVLCGCNSDELENEVETISAPQATKSCMLHFPNKEMLFEAINDSIPNELTRASGTAGFVSLMNEVDLDDPALNTLTFEERNYIAQNNLTYYEAFDYESLVPNEKFAGLLNHKAEICCDGEVYKITEYGTLVAQEEHLDELEAISETLDDVITFNKDENEKQLSSNVKIINSFGERGNFKDLDKMDDGRNDGDPVIGDGSSEGSSGGSSGGTSGGSNTPSPSYTNTPLSDIPFSSFKTYSANSETFVGQILQNLFGSRSVKHHEFKDGYRVSGSLYDYDYGVYRECGVFVSMDKKRGGFLKRINGWKSIKASELVMDLESIVLTVQCDFPMDIAETIPQMPTVSGYDTEFAYWGRKTKCVNIFGYNITESDVYELAGKGLKEALNYLSNLCNKTIDANTQAVQIVTPSKAYTVLYSHPIYAHNQHKIRKVFSHGVNFAISSTVITQPTEISSYVELLGLLKSQPRFSIKKGKVRLAGRFDESWGGLIINK